MIIDSHLHLSFKELGAYTDKTLEIIKEAKAGGVEILLDIATDASSFKKAIDFSKYVKELNNSNMPKIYNAIGIHPLHITDNKNFTENDLEKYINEDSVIAVGEIGFDGHYSKDNFKIQEDFFVKHANVAKKYSLPIIIHTREANEYTIKNLENFVKETGLSGVIHCFAGNKNFAKQILNLGFYISFSGILTYKNSLNEKEVASYVPLDRVFVETDAPYLVPNNFRKYKEKICKPLHVIETFKYFCFLRKETEQEIRNSIKNNFSTLFKVSNI